MLTRRSFLAGVLGAAVAPTFVRRESLGGLWVPKRDAVTLYELGPHYVYLDFSNEIWNGEGVSGDRFMIFPPMPGIHIHPVTGAISGTPTAPGHYFARVATQSKVPPQRLSPRRFTVR